MNSVIHWSFLIAIFCLSFVRDAECAIKWNDDMNNKVFCEALPVSSSPVYTLAASGTAPVKYWLEDVVYFSMCNGDEEDGGKSPNGDVCVDQQLNREDDDSPRFSVCASDATDENCNRISIQVSDANDNPPQFLNTPYIVNMDEGVTTGDLVLTAVARDVDESYSAIIDFSLEDATVFELKNAEYNASTKQYSVQVHLKDNLDFEESQIHVVNLIAQDRGNLTTLCGDNINLDSSTTLYLNVVDEPDTAPIFTKIEYRGNVMEGTKDLTGDNKVTARDGDYGLNWDIEYSLAEKSDIFDINSDTGELSVKKAVDRESSEGTDGSFILTVVATEVVSSSYSTTPMSSNTTVTVTVVDVNDNKPLFYTSSDYTIETSEYTATVAENSVNAIPDLDIFVKDPDQGVNAKFTLALGGKYASEFSLTPETADSKATVSIIINSDASILDFETLTSLQLTIIATETTAPFNETEATINLTITDMNDNFPVFETVDVIASVPEASPKGAIVTTIEVSDADSEENIKLSLMPADSFDIHQNGSVYVANEELDRELRSEYYLTVIAVDIGGLVNSTQLTITIEDVNDNAPRFQPDQYSANWIENVTTSSVTVYALDLDEGGNKNSYLTLEFVENDMDALYNITQTRGEGSIQGVIQPINPLDAEKMNGTCNNDIIRYSFEVIVFDNGVPAKNDTVEISVYLQDANDFIPEFKKNLYNGSVPEESLRDTVIANISASDGDKCPPNNEIGYSVDPSFADKFSIIESDSYSTLVVRSERLDRDEQDKYDVIVYAIDNGQPRKSSTVNVTVTITDINNKRPFFNSSLNEDTVDIHENATLGDTITVLVADDPDLDSNLTYTISSASCQDENGNGDSELCENWFEIKTVEQEGKILVASELDREVASTVTLIVRVKDNAADTSDEQTALWTVVISMLDVNDNSPEFSEIPTFTVIEEATNGSTIGQISATDKDEDQKITFSTENTFINITTTGELFVQSRIDRERSPGDNFTAIIFATDNGEPHLTSNVTVQFIVEDINDQNPVFKNETYECSVEEEMSSNTTVCSVLATDDDIGENAEIFYSIQTEDEFKIDRSSGRISTTSILDRETLDVYELIVTATDNAGDQSRTADAQITIRITDVDDSNPTYGDSTLTMNMEIKEEEEPEAFIGEVEKANDADTEEFQNNFYFLVYKDDSIAREHFRLDKTTRELYTTTLLDREEQSFYELYVFTTKNESITSDEYPADVETSILPINVSVLDINDNAPQFTSSRYTGDLQVGELPSTTNVVLAARATDKDEGVFAELMYSMTSDPEGMFSIDSKTGNVYLSSAIEGGIGDSYELQLLVTDGGELTGEASAVVRIFDIDETIVLSSRRSVEDLTENKETLEKDLEAALDADVVIDSIVPHDTSAAAARAVADGSIQSDIYFHASNWNETALIPAEDVIIELDNSQNTEVLIEWGIVSIDNPNDPTGVGVGDETDLLKAILVVACVLCIVVLIVYTIAFILMRKRYQRKLKAESAFHNVMPDDNADAENIPNTNKNKTGENPLMLENQKGNIDLEQWLRSQESNDDDNSIDDNAVDSQDSAISADPRDTTDFSQTNEDNLDDIDIDFNDANVASLAAALNARSGADEIVLAFDNEAMDHTAM